MKRISFWAKRNKWPARLLIIVSFILLNAIGINVGSLLYGLKVFLPLIALTITVFFYFWGFIFYPRKRQRAELGLSAFYVRQKTCDFLLAASAFLMAVYIGNRPTILFFNNSLEKVAASTTSVPGDSSAKTYKSISTFSAGMKDKNGKTLKWKERKKLLKEQIRGIKKANNLSKAEKISLIVLSVLAAALLLYLVAGVACELSCNGADGAALLVGIGGTALVFFLLIIAIRAILGIKKKHKQKSSTSG